ncbi:glycosyltransferase family 2 protein [Agrobacterium sp. AGB01]|uniref:glycosyltransferase family 2 protein n=1 Tax=Agrobacterium sp. AGB01 TaxID=2769302 RepID=UPI001785F339|nr:glycosyltransferase family 2 protein [Agrobacterium sp. AGB01]MBD9388219.1 glycosyltransferase family 2 protein [Agrobacterium sp. AGB01]
MPPLISVVIPAFNRSSLIVGCLESVFQQTYKNIEVLVVDDKSTDDTLNVLHSISDKRLRIISLTKNGGGSVARNSGIEAARGEYIAFLDSDDRWLPNKLEVQLSKLISYGDRLSVSYTNVIIDDGVSSQALYNKPNKSNRNILEYLFLNWSEAHIQTSSWLMRTEIARTVKFDETLRLHQDWDFLVRAEILGYNFLEIREPLTVWLMDHRPDRVSLASNRFSRSMIWLQKWEGHIGRKGVLAFKARRAPENAHENFPRSLYWVLQGLVSRAVSPRPSLKLLRACFGSKFRQN